MLIFEQIVKFFDFDVDLRGQVKVDVFFNANLWKSLDNSTLDYIDYIQKVQLS